MAFLEIAIRGGAIALFLLLAASAVPRARKSAVARYDLLFALCGVAYLIESASDLAGRPDAWLLPVRVFSLSTPAVFWLWTAAHFDDEFEPARWRWLPWLGLIALSGWAESVQRAYAWHAVHLAWILIIGLGVGQVLAGRKTDLVESRRRLRVVLAIGTAALLAGFSTVEFAAQGRPGVAVATIAAAAMAVAAFSFALLRPVFATETPAPVPEPATVNPEAPRSGGKVMTPNEEETGWLERLRALMEHDKAYREEGLSIRSLAERLGIAEYRLRRLINQRLGYRNFNVFLNNHRIEEAKAALSDPTQAKVPVITIAMDAGFQSLGPFNRAFKATTGVTPTEYRRLNAPAA
jgi:AraC-like DNA-binding protein